MLSQNFLVDRHVVRALVGGSGVGSGDLAVDIGAGNGLITAELAGTGARVLAIERDPRLADRLRQRFRGEPSVLVVAGDVLDVAMPQERFQVVANVPFAITTKILRRLLSDLSQRGDDGFSGSAGGDLAEIIAYYKVHEAGTAESGVAPDRRPAS